MNLFYLTKTVFLADKEVSFEMISDGLLRANRIMELMEEVKEKHLDLGFEIESEGFAHLMMSNDKDIVVYFEICKRRKSQW
jgi:hypothetical protein